ncbi:hypothetical protein LWI28_007960 [Acer negundo]|uniref:PGG domain-containing protein n=1 Tax=Acer negundo TaxID=4023 RepID=A0AAD5P2G0_ACENE|nr:hypothetical protein LWI28_007960 [Acer negundo]
MDAATVANVSVVSSEIEMTDAAAGSESYINNNNIEETVASTSHNQEKNFELLDSVYSAAADGNIDKFQQHAWVLDQILTPNGNTILHIHITSRRQPRSRISQNMDFVREILEMCPDLLWKANKKGETLLHMAARHGHADVAKFLLEECKKPFQNDRELGIKNTRQMLMINEAKDTALHEAVRYNHLDVVKVLIEEDCELPYDANKAGETPLYLAAERGYAEVMQEILRTCISPADHGPNSRRALHATVIRNDIGMTILLLDDRRFHKSEQDQQRWTPLHLAAHLGYIGILKTLLIKDRSAAYKADNEGKTALHVAAGLGRVDIMQEFISSCPGCCELVDNRGRNVLQFAVKSKNRNAVRLVLRNPWFTNLINEKNEEGSTAFLLSVSVRSIINHPKVDRLVFNNSNDNAVNIDANNDDPTPWKWHELIRWFLIWGEIHRGRRLMSNIFYREGKETKINAAVSRKGKDGDENGNGNGRSSRDDSVKKARQNELVTATLIATVTFAAGLTVPGGFISENGPDQGAAILTRNTAFKVFVLLNSMSMFFSSLAVFTHLFRWHYLEAHKTWSRKMRLRRFLIVLAMLAMIGAFLSGTCALLYRDKNLAISACVVPVAGLAFLASEVDSFMEAATVEMIDVAAGSESYINNNIIEETVASSSNNQEKNFEILDSVYSAAADGDINNTQGCLTKY